ncbi:MAG: hypothetical protein PHV37_08035 [Candidatus Gastranaerophilales bacterium]|nr:hypothetical protein [Candidatus Gastranaerophilales bacterium]
MRFSVLNTTANAVSFKSARVNILASSDNHGNLTTLPDFFNTIKENKEDIFQKSEDESTLNLFVNAGDFYINPSKKGFRTYPESTNGNIQKRFLRKLIQEVKNLLPKNSNFDAVYTPGNHCFDGGDDTLLNLVDMKEMTTVVSNIDKRKSPIYKDLSREKMPLVDSKEYSIPDSDDPDYKHHVMILGATIPTMKFYNPGLLKRLSFFDDQEKKDAQLKKEDLTKTFEVLNEKVSDFKERYPNGVVLFSSHMGTKISKMIRDEVPGINETFDAHQHDCSTISKGLSSISSLGKDNELVKSIALTLEKNGDIERETSTYFTKLYKMDNLETNGVKKLLGATFKKDMEPLINIVDKKKELEELPYDNDIRYANSYLANYLTSAIKRSVREDVPDIDIVGVQSSIIRGGLKNGSNNLDMMKIFDGVSEDLSGVEVGKVKGEDLVGLIVENVKGNIAAKTRNTIIHWSDIKVDRTLLEKILSGEEKHKTAYDAVKIRNKNEKSSFVKINPEKDYTMAIAEKYLIKDDIEYPKKIRENFVPLHKTYDELFRNYLEEIDYNLLITDKTKEKRIV